MNGSTNPMTWSTESIRSIGAMNCSAPLNRPLISWIALLISSRAWAFSSSSRSCTSGADSQAAENRPPSPASEIARVRSPTCAATT